jgi:hypothetical protein
MSVFCADQNCATTPPAANLQIVNYGNSAADLGDVSATPGATYFLFWKQPAALNGKTWNTYWWSGGSTITTSDQMQMRVQGYNRRYASYLAENEAPT